jgi:hypothetical protein
MIQRNLQSLAFNFALLLCVCIYHPMDIHAESQPLVFATWDIFEVDKCASIWLIKRFIDTEAQIRLYPKGEQIKKGILFDTPDAKFRRYHNASTYETLLRHYKIRGDRLIYIGRIVHDIEVNTWEKKVMKESGFVTNKINRIINQSKSNREVIDGSLFFFDAFYANLKNDQNM